jgi:hypothetical protein
MKRPFSKSVANLTINTFSSKKLLPAPQKAYASMKRFGDLLNITPPKLRIRKSSHPNLNMFYNTEKVRQFPESLKLSATTLGEML